MVREAGAVKYDFGASGIPDHLQKVAVIELTPGTAVPADVPEYDLTYYDAPNLIPPAVVALAAHAYSLGQAIPAMLRRICAFVAALVEMTTGDELFFDDTDNSAHIATTGL